MKHVAIPFLLLLLTTLVELGCYKSPPRNAMETGIARVRYEELRLMAQKKLECPAEKLSYQYLGSKTHLLAGCGREVRYLIFALDGIWVKIESFHERASFELECAVDKLKIEHLDERKWRAFGCGRRATYLLDCEEELRKCVWQTAGQQR